MEVRGKSNGRGRSWAPSLEGSAKVEGCWGMGATPMGATPLQGMP